VALLSRSRRSRVVGWSLVLVLGLSGCAGRPALPPTYGLPVRLLPPPPTEDVRKTYGTIGVGWLADTPQTGLHTQAIIGRGVGTAGGVGAGALAGFAAGAQAMGGCGGGGAAAGFCVLVVLILLGVTTGVGAVVGGVIGFQNTIPASAPSAVEAMAAQAATELALSQTLAETLLRRLQAETRHPVVALSALPADPADRAQTVSGQVDSLLEVSVPQMGFTGAGGGDPPLALLFTARVRLLRATTGEVLYAADFEYRGPVRALSAWATVGAETYRGELDRAHAILADRIVDEILFVYLPPQWGATR